MAKKILLSLVTFLISGSAYAAQLYLKPDTSDLQVSQEKIVTLYLDSPEGVNALEGRLVYPSRLLELKDVSDGNSIISLWIERPVLPVDPKGESAEIKFAGAVPGGFSANNGRVLTFRFRAVRSGNAAIALKGAQALLNDGAATKANLSLAGASFRISGSASSAPAPKEEVIADGLPPEAFVPEVSSDQNIFDGKYFLTFSTQDKGSGIDYYEVSEEQGVFRPLVGPSYKNFKKVDSPYLLSDQSLKSWIFVRAIDKQGNERMVILEPIKRAVSFRLLTVLLGIIVILLLSLVGRKIYVSRRKARNSSG